MRGTRRVRRGRQPDDLGDGLLADRGFAARPSRTLPSPTSPSKAKSLRRARTVTGVTPTSSAITVLARLSAAINNTRVRNTRRCGAD